MISGGSAAGSALPGVPRAAATYLERGRLANLDQVASATLSTAVGGPADGCRALDLRVAGGIDVRILLDRGFDLGPAWFGGVPVAWISEVGETGPLDSPTEMDWMEAFGGGLVTTCGLRNVGAPSEGHGMHGTYSHLRASEAHTERAIEDGHVVLTARARIDDRGGGLGHLRLRREIRTRTGTGLVELADVTTNLGREPEPAPILYHVNVGVPLWEDGARLEIDSQDVVPRDDDAAPGLASWMVPPPVSPRARELVFEHRMPAGSGWGRAAVVNPSVGLRLVLEWERHALPRFHQWVHPRTGVWALGLEPANCSVLGRAADRAAGTLPILQPDEERVSRLRVRVGPA
jgi:Domain of unknown function (DUF4432)